jgi:hypothetical protein
MQFTPSDECHIDTLVRDDGGGASRDGRLLATAKLGQRRTIRVGRGTVRAKGTRSSVVVVSLPGPSNAGPSNAGPSNAGPSKIGVWTTPSAQAEHGCFPRGAFVQEGNDLVRCGAGATSPVFLIRPVRARHRSFHAAFARSSQRLRTAGKLEWAGHFAMGPLQVFAKVFAITFRSIETRLYEEHGNA